MDEIAIVADKIIYQAGDQPNEHLSVIAKILVKINASSDGQKLFSDIIMPYNTLERLNHEMKKFESTLSTEQCGFESEVNIKVKTEIKSE